jgi:hypothetical protein
MYKKALPAVLATVFAACLFALPAIGADDPPPVTNEDLSASVNNLKQIVLAFHNHNDTYGNLPISISDKDGKPLLSWRVAILPFIEEGPLFMEFKLDEPWDSDNNKKLIEKMPKIYAPIRVKAKAGETFYQVFAGKDALFGNTNDPKKKPSIPTSIPDGTSNTGMVFEAGEPVVWTKPVDLPFDEKKALPKLGGLFDGDFHVGMGDGSVILVKKDADEKVLKNLIMPADGNPIDINAIKK